jgi:hypothetical protein
MYVSHKGGKLKNLHGVFYINLIFAILFLFYLCGKLIGADIIKYLTDPQKPFRHINHLAD